MTGYRDNAKPATRTRIIWRRLFARCVLGLVGMAAVVGIVALLWWAYVPWGLEVGDKVDGVRFTLRIFSIPALGIVGLYGIGWAGGWLLNEASEPWRLRR